MNLKKKLWIIYTLCALLSIVIWYIYSYPQMTFVTLTVDRTEALKIANEYVSSIEPDLHDFKHSITFKRSQMPNQYLQKTIGLDKLNEFIETYNFDLFYWSIAFFKEGDKEQYAVTVSSRTGQVIGYSHSLEETAKIDIITKNEARADAIRFLNERFNFDTDNYEIKGDLTTIYDFRNDHTFAWLHKDVSIPWTIKGGTGKLISSITISGDQVLRFSHHTFQVPEDFNRDLAKQGNISDNLSVVVRIFSMIFYISAVYFVVSRRNHLAMHTTKKTYIFISVIVFTLSMLGFFNSFESILSGYVTTSPFNSYLVRFFINAFVGTVMSSFFVLMPGLSGELIHFEVFKDKKQGSLLKYIHSTFFSREVAKSIFLGYFVFIILLGIQSLILKLGQKYCGVWVEYSWMTTLTSAYFPFLAGITLGFQASVSEEILYRMFGISLGKKIFKNTAAAVIASSLLWGFAHSTYPVYPMWFRAVEVSILGIFLSYIYLKYGFICTLVAHYVFDAFWHSTGYLFGEVHAYYLISSIFVIALPLIFGIIAFILNRKTEEKPMRWYLNKHQQFNKTILLTYLNVHQSVFKDKPAETIKEEIAGHGWDFAVVDVAVEDFLDKPKDTG
ncbi:MAG: CPBP family intramembrane glutamic endopeptidase [Candidatus Omnitrophota bacterium]